MELARIERMRARYHLTAAQAGEKTRLDRIMRSMIDDVLDVSLAGLGIGPNEQLCIRRLSHRATIDLAERDEAASIAWAESITRMIREKLARGDSDLVRYYSIEHAIFDLVISSAQGRFARVWAWRSLGLWRAREDSGKSVAEREVHRLLLEHPQQIVAVFIAIARAEAWPAFFELLPPPRSTALLRALYQRTGRQFAQSSSITELPPTFAPAAIGELLARSLIFRSVRSELFLAWAREDREPELAELLLVAALLEVDPTFVERRAVELSVMREVPSALEWVIRVATGVRIKPRVKSARASSPEAPVEAKGRSPVPRDPEEQPVPKDKDVPLPQSTETDEPPLDLRERGRTRAGGLLFLHHLVHALGLPAKIAREEAFDARSMKSVMHRLALALLPCEPNDPAVLAFGGMGPERGLILLDQPVPSTREAELLESYAAELVSDLRERLDDQQSSRDQLLLRVCRREAQVIADPGWIELHLQLDETSVEVRRAGLDLDLGWVPAIGVVVRFVYV